MQITSCSYTALEWAFEYMKAWERLISKDQSPIDSFYISVGTSACTVTRVVREHARFLSWQTSLISQSLSKHMPLDYRHSAISYVADCETCCLRDNCRNTRGRKNLPFAQVIHSRYYTRTWCPKRSKDLD